MNSQKIIEKMKNQPRGVRLYETEKVLAVYDYSFNRQKGSHRHYLNSQRRIIQPQRDPAAFPRLMQAV